MSKNNPGRQESETPRQTKTAALDSPKNRIPKSQADLRVEDALEDDEVREALKSRQQPNASRRL